MKKILSLVLAITIVLSTLVTSILVSAGIGECNVSDIYTTPVTGNHLAISTNDKFEASTMTVYDWSYGLSAMGWSGTWRQTLLFFDKTTNAQYNLKANAKYIVSVNYTIVQSNDSWGVQMGLFGGIAANGVTDNNTSTRLDTHFAHKTADVGKTFTYSAEFTAAKAQNIGLQFAGSGSVTFNSITISEVTSQYVGDFVTVKYVDGVDETKEFVKKNGSLKTLTKQNATFVGWYNNSSFSGEPVTTVTGDVTLYAKWKLETYNTYNIHTTLVTGNHIGGGSGTGFSNSTISINDWSYGLSAMGWGGTWRQSLLFFDKTTNAQFNLKANAKYIVKVNYTIVKSNDSWGVQLGLFGGILANGVTNNSTSTRLDTHFAHKSADVGKTFDYSTTFTASKAQNIGLQFAGNGSVTFNSITILEVPAENVGDFVSVTYIDGDNKTVEFADKNTAVKIPVKQGIAFSGWYKNADFTGEKVTTITEDVILYAKWGLESHNTYNIHTTLVTGNHIGAASGDNFVDSTVTVNDWSYGLGSMGWGGTWRQTLLFFNKANDSAFYLQENAKYIVTVDYTVVKSNDSWGVQFGLFGGILANGVTDNNTTARLDAHFAHKNADVGKTFTYTAQFTSTKTQNIGLQFAGNGSVTFNSITISEVPASEVDNFVTVTFVDNKKSLVEFVKKEVALKTPVREYYQFGGWYDNSDFSGEAITSVNEDKTVYAKWELEPNSVVIDFHDGDITETVRYDVDSDLNKVPQKAGYNFLGWYKYSNYVGRPYTKAVKGITELYAKWEEINPQVEKTVDITKNDKLITTQKSSESKSELDSGKLIFNIHNYERQLNKTDTSNSDSWFPSYYLYDENGNLIELEIGTAYELEVKYKVVNVAAGDTVGIQIGFGADGQNGQTRTKIKGYAMHTASDEGKEFTYTTSYTAEKFNFGVQHLPKLLFSGQGKVEVTSVKIKKVLPIIKDTVIGIQTYEAYKAGTNSGVLGNKKGTEVTDTVNHTLGLLKKNALKLDLNTEYLRVSGNTIISFEDEGKMKAYVAEKGGAYRITFYMYANEDLNNLHWSINSVDEVMEKDYLKYFKLEKDGEVSLKKGEWTEIVAYIPVLKGGESSKNLFAIAVASNGYDGKSVYIDDVKIEQLVDSEVLLYDSMGGTELEAQRAFAGQEFISFKEPTKEGYLFDGWYYDAEYNSEAKTYDKFPTDKYEITLYAKWIEAPTTAYNFTAGSFDTEIYNSNVVPYENTIADADTKFEGENQKGMTENSVWVKDAGIYANGSRETDGALAFSNELYSNYTDSRSYNVVKLVNEDGTPYTVVKGERYTIKFDYIFASAKGLSYIVPIISENSAYTEMGKNTSQTIGRVSVMETDTDYMTYSQSFVAEKTGYVYIALTGRDDNANVDTHCYEKVYVDNLEIKLNPDVIKIDIKKGSTLWYTKYGIKGEKLILPNAVKSGTDTFDGLYLDPEFTNKFDGYYPTEDTTLYVKLKKDKYDIPSDFSNPIVLDFEETELLNDFYRQQKYMTSWSRETQNEWIFVTNDEANALNGKNYIKLNGFSHYWNQAKFALYDPSHPENVMLLDKGGKYRVTLMVRCEDLYEAPVNMTVCLENPSQQHLLAENGSVKLEYIPAGDKEGYFMFVGDIEVKEDMAYYPSLAIRRNANDLQTLFIDTVSVEKLRDCTVTYEENGGTEVEDAVIQIHDLLYDPGVPYKEGFVLDGWCTDKELTKFWNFDTDTVENDMVLYAKWSVEVIEEEPEIPSQTPEQTPEQKPTETPEQNGQVAPEKTPEPEQTPVVTPEEEPEEEMTQDSEETTDDAEDETFESDDSESEDFTDDEEVTDEGNGEQPTLLEADKVVIDDADVEQNTEKNGMPVWAIILICVGSVIVLGGIVFVTVILIRKKK